MADDFRYDVFLSHSSHDKVVVRDVAERLRDGLRVWLDEWEIPFDAPLAHRLGFALVMCFDSHFGNLTIPETPGAASA